MIGPRREGGKSQDREGGKSQDREGGESQDREGGESQDRKKNSPEREPAKRVSLVWRGWRSLFINRESVGQEGQQEEQEAGPD